MTPSSTALCVNDQTLAAFACGGLDPLERAGVEKHLASCDDCLQAAAAAAMADAPTPAGAAPMPDLLDGRFEVGLLIAQGGMGAVYEGRDVQTGRRVAIKRLKPGVDDERGELRQRFEREGEVLRQLDHPNVVKMLGTALDGDRLHIVMEYVAGGSLRDLLREEPRMPVARALPIVLELSDALARAHHLRVIHRDIKPENVLMAEDGTPRLSDFGLARVGAPALTRSGTVMGTVAYQSPEALWGHAVDERADIWALGITLFEMLAGRQPFSGFHPATIITAILHQPAPSLESLCPNAPLALSRLIHRMLEKDPRRRVASVRQVGAELQAILRAPLADSEVVLRSRSSSGSSTTPAAPTRPSQLPVPSTPFTGREAELRQIAAWLASPADRLLSILGSGGSGKSRLAIEAALRLSQGSAPFRQCLASDAQFDRGVFFVDLAGLSSPDLAAAAVGNAIGFRFCTGVEAPRQLVDYLREKSLLLVLDNFAQMVEGGNLLNELLAAAPRVKVLATSRNRLGMQAEGLLLLSGMTVAARGEMESVDSSEAMQLFLATARRVVPSFEIETEEAVREAARLCRDLQGLPLSIVLVASRIGPMDLREVKNGLWSSAVPNPELSQLPDQERSVRAIFGHTWSFLDAVAQSKSLDLPRAEDDASERRLSPRVAFNHTRSLLDAVTSATLAKLGVFKGHFTLAGAATVAGATEAVLEELTTRALLRRSATLDRYVMHELLQEYAVLELRERPEEYEQTLDLHADYHANCLAERGKSLKGPESQQATRQIELELRDIRAAWRRLLMRKRLPALGQSIEALSSFYALTAALAEAESAFQAAADALTEDAPERGTERARLAGRARSLQASYCADQGRHADATHLARRALELLDERTQPLEAGQALLTLGVGLCMLGRVSEGSAQVERSLSLLRSAGARWETAQALALVGQQRGWLGLTKATAYLEESVLLQRSLGEQVEVVPSSLSALGAVQSERGNYVEACQLASEALEIAQRQGDRWTQSVCMQSLVGAHRKQGNYAEAEALARNNLAFVQEFFPFAECLSQTLLGEVLKERQRLQEAWVHCQLGLRNSNAFTMAVAQAQLGDIAWLRRETYEARLCWEECLEAFERLGLRWGLVVTLDHLGYLACHEEQYAGAQQYFQRAAEVASSSELWAAASSVLAGMALLLARSNEPRRAAELVALAQCHPATEHQTRARRVEPLLAELSRVLSPAELAAALERGRQIDIESALSAVF